MKKILAAFAANTVFANIVLVMIFMGGALALTSMLRESFPQFSLDMISVQVVYPIFILRSFQQGADAVWVSGCHPGDCHYDSGNYYARRRMLVLRELLDLLGIEPERLQLSFISAAEGKKCAEVAAEITELIRKLGPLELDDGKGRDR